MRQISSPRVLSMKEHDSYDIRFLTFCNTAVVSFPMAACADSMDQVLEDAFFLAMQEDQIDPITNACRREFYEAS